jgi:hypothetical protein
MPFAYPTERLVRRYAPEGYTDYASFKPWLRDEFTFRCVFCLLRERMVEPAGQDIFSVEHLLPRSTHPHLTCDYANLVYACLKCNSNKSDQGPVLDPCRTAYGNHLSVASDGTIRATSRDGRKLVRLVRLDREELTEFRGRVLRLAEAAERQPRSLLARELLPALLGFPSDMPDIRRLRPPTNRKPDSPNDCYFARRERGALPERY